MASAGDGYCRSKISDCAGPVDYSFGADRIGLYPFHGNWLDCLIGGAVGFGVMGFVAILGKMAYRRDTLGGGDIKLFASLGLITGLNGILIIFVIATLISAAHLIWLLARKK